MAGERARIARELHDIVAHGISVMVLQAGAARQVLDQDAERAREPLLTVESTGRQALDEMHRLLEVLRRDDTEARDPGAGLGQLEALAARMADTGLQVELSVRGEPHDLAPSLDLSAYRIVQEALTNALKHSGSARARVDVRWTDDALELAVRDADDRPASTAGQVRDHRGAEAAGHGLVGMRERVALFGGELAVGPDPAGGWTVRARLPVEGART